MSYRMGYLLVILSAQVSTFFPNAEWFAKNINIKKIKFCIFLSPKVVEFFVISCFKKKKALAYVYFWLIFTKRLCLTLYFHPSVYY